MYSLHSTLNFGKHNNRLVWVVAVCDPTYLDWCIKNIDGFCIENLEDLETLPLYNSLTKDPDAIKKMRDKISLNPELFQIKTTNPQYIEDYFTEKGYDFYINNFKPFLTQCYKFKADMLELNNRRILQERIQELKYDSYDPSEKYTFDDTINDAFEGDYSNYSNVD